MTIVVSYDDLGLFFVLTNTIQSELVITADHEKRGVKDFRGVLENPGAGKLSTAQDVPICECVYLFLFTFDWF